MPLFSGPFIPQPLFARSVRDLGNHNHSCPGVLKDVIVYLNNGDSFMGAIISFDPLGPDTFSAKAGANEIQEYEFGTAPEQVQSITCRGKSTCDTSSFHVPKQSLETAGGFESSRRFP